MTALITTTAASTTRSAPSASATNEASPGVSIRLILRSAYSNGAMLAPIDIERACSSGSKSKVVEPSSTLPSRLMTPASNRSASQRLVFPLPRWPISATLRIRSAALCPTGANICVSGRRPELRARLETRPQAQHGLRVELRHAGFGHSEDLADLPQGEVLVVVEGDDQPLALGQRFDGVREPVLELRGMRLNLGIDRVWVLNRVESGDLASAALRIRERPQVVERQHRGVRDLEQRVVELIDVHLELRGHLLVSGRALKLSLQLRVRLLDVARACPDRPGHPVERAELVDDRALDACDGERLELDLAVEVEALDRADQAQEAVGDEVCLLDVRGQARGHPAGDELHERRVGDHEPLPRALVPLILVAPPELPKFDSFDVCLHRRPC